MITSGEATQIYRIVPIVAGQHTMPSDSRAYIHTLPLGREYDIYDDISFNNNLKRTNGHDLNQKGYRDDRSVNVVVTPPLRGRVPTTHKINILTNRGET